MGLVLLNTENLLRENGFIPDSVSHVKIRNLITRLLNSKNQSVFDAIAEKEFWYFAEALRQEFHQSMLRPAFLYKALPMQ